MESDSDNIDVNDAVSNASVHLYMPVDRDSVDSAGDGVWQNVTLEPPHHSSQAEGGASYIPLQCMPQHTCGRQWHVFADSADSSEADEPLVDFSHVVVPAPSTLSSSSVEKSDKCPVSNNSDCHLCLKGIEPSAGCIQNDCDFRQQVAGAASVQEAGMVYQS